MIGKLMLVTAAAMLAVFAIACGDDDDNGDTPANTPTPVTTAAPGDPTAAPTEQPAETPDPEPSNIPPGLQRIIDAARDGDLAALEALVRYEPVACSNIGEGAGGPPRCEAGEAEGTLVNVAFAASCEGFWVREGNSIFESAGFTGFGNGDPIHGIYDAEGAPLQRVWTDAEYAVVMTYPGPADEPLAFALLVDDGEVIGYTAACGGTAEQFVEFQELGDPIVE